MALVRVLLVSVAICYCISASSKVEAKHLPHLPHDVLQLIFENLQFPHLYRVVESHPALIQPAISAFRHVHSKKPVRIYGKGFQIEKQPSRPEERFGGINRFIDIGDYNLTLQFFDIFGTSVKNLYIQYNGMDESQIVEIEQLVRETCADKLKHIGMEFDSSNESVLVSYPNVESVTISEANFRMSESIDFNQLYPKMVSLELGRNLIESGKLLCHHLPLLEHFVLNLPLTKRLDESRMEQMLRNNTQIKSVAFAEISTRFLSVLGSLPGLESLELSLTPIFLSEPSTSHRLENIRKFTFHTYSDGDMTYIPFAFGDQLEEVKMASLICMKLMSHWVRFFESNQNIQRLSFEFEGKKCVQFAHIPDLRLPNVRELELKNVDLTWIEETEEFLSEIGQWEKLERIHLVDVQIDDEVEILKARISEGWTMTQFQNEDSDDLVDITLTKVANIPRLPSKKSSIVSSIADDLNRIFTELFG